MLQVDLPCTCSLGIPRYSALHHPGIRSVFKNYFLLTEKGILFHACLGLVQPEEPFRERKVPECLQASHFFFIWSATCFRALHTELLLKEKMVLRVHTTCLQLFKKNSFSFQTKSTPLQHSALRDKDDMELVRCFLVGWASAETYKWH